MNRAALNIGVFSAEILGKSLKQMPAKTFKAGVQDITTNWYHSDRDVDLYIWRDERANIIKQQLQFHGQIVEWNIIEGTRTGLVVEGGTDGATVNDPKAPVRFDPVRQAYTVEQVIEILRAIQEIAEAERTSLIKNFAESPNFADLSPDQVLSLYGRPDNMRNRLMAWFDRLVFLFQFGRKR
jgi:hypothetical protein